MRFLRVGSRLLEYEERKRWTRRNIVCSQSLCHAHHISTLSARTSSRISAIPMWTGTIHRRSPSIFHLYLNLPTGASCFRLGPPCHDAKREDVAPVLHCSKFPSSLDWLCDELKATSRCREKRMNLSGLSCICTFPLPATQSLAEM